MNWNMRKYLIADLLTGSRFVWAVVLVGLVLFKVEPAMWVVLVTTLALLTDALDGAAARRWPYPNDNKYRWWRRVQKAPDGSFKTVACLDTPADIVLGIGLIIYTFFMVDRVWGMVLFSAVPLGLIGLFVIGWAESRSKVELKLLRNIRLAMYFLYMVATLGVWLFALSSCPLVWTCIYMTGALVLAYLKRGRLIYGKAYNQVVMKPKRRSRSTKKHSR
jgi:phosphatidylglycerophosphate synthase